MVKAAFMTHTCYPRGPHMLTCLHASLGPLNCAVRRRGKPAGKQKQSVAGMAACSSLCPLCPFRTIWTAPACDGDMRIYACTAHWVGEVLHAVAAQHRVHARIRQGQALRAAPGRHGRFSLSGVRAKVHRLEHGSGASLWIGAGPCLLTESRGGSCSSAWLPTCACLQLAAPPKWEMHPPPMQYCSTCHPARMGPSLVHACMARTLTLSVLRSCTK